MKTAKVKHLLEKYNNEGLDGVIKYLEDPELVIYERTFCSRVKENLSNKYYISTEAELASLLHTFKILNDEHERD